MSSLSIEFTYENWFTNVSQTQQNKDNMTSTAKMSEKISLNISSSVEIVSNGRLQY